MPSPNINLESLAELESIVSTNPSAEEFVELAQILADIPERRAEAREICFQGITSNPDLIAGRLILAKLFYLDSMPEFAARELFEIKKRLGKSTASLDKLLFAFKDFISEERIVESRNDNKDSNDEEMQILPEQTKSEQIESEVVAEIDLDADILDFLSEFEEESE